GPAQLHIAIFFFLPHNLIQVAEGQYGQSQLSVLLLDPEEQTPQSGDLPPIYEESQVRVPDFHHVLSHLQCLIVTQGDVAPVAGPAVVVYLPDQSKLTSRIL